MMSHGQTTSEKWDPRGGYLLRRARHGDDLTQTELGHRLDPPVTRDRIAGFEQGEGRGKPPESPHLEQLIAFIEERRGTQAWGELAGNAPRATGSSDPDQRVIELEKEIARLKKKI